ncbi:MAG: response regulator transcription factor [Tissierellia bacterium]|nr:response regulator transcription factor [Tissierellia bacterium]
MNKTKVMIVDDQYVPRQMFTMYIERSENYELVNTVYSAEFADTYILKNEVDLILMDILMKDGPSGLKAAEKIKKIKPEIKIIAVTSMPEVSWIKKAKEIGIESFWYKEASEETIISVMDRTMKGESVYPHTLPKIKIGLSDVSELTERELDVLREMTAGLSNSAIAKKLGMAETTVKTHIRHLIEKTGCDNRTQLAIRARVSGVVVSEEDS